MRSPEVRWEMEQPLNNTQRLLEALSEMMRQEDTKQRMVEQIGCSLRLIVGCRECLVVDARQVSGATTHRDDMDTKVDATLEISEDAFDLVCAGRMNPAHAFMTGRLKVTGDMLRAIKSNVLFKLLREAQPSEHRLKSRL